MDLSTTLSIETNDCAEQAELAAIPTGTVSPRREPKPRKRRMESAANTRFEQGIDELPFVRSLGKGQGRDFWHIGEARPGPHGGPVITANYTLDCELGRALGRKFIEVAMRYPDQAYDITEYTLKWIARTGRCSSVEVAFLDHVAALVDLGVRATRSTPEMRNA